MIISIEGLDGAGKETTCKALAACFKENLKDINVQVISFPDYESASGELIKQILRSNDIRNAIPEYRRPTFISELFAINRHEYFKKNKIDLNDPNKIYIMDRYIHSNLFYQGVTLSNNSLILLANTIIDIDTQVYGNRFPDFSFFLDVPYETLRERLDARTQSKSGVDDNYEKDSFLKNVFHVANTLMALRQVNTDNDNLFPKYVVATENLSPEDIAMEIFATIISKLNNNESSTSQLDLEGDKK